MIKRRVLGVQEWVPDYILEWSEGVYFTDNSWNDDEYSIIVRNLCKDDKLAKAWENIDSREQFYNYNNTDYFSILFVRDLTIDAYKSRTQYYLDNKTKIDDQKYNEWALKGYETYLEKMDQQHEPKYNRRAKENDAILLDYKFMKTWDKCQRWEEFAKWRGAKYDYIDENILNDIAEQANKLYCLIQNNTEVKNILESRDITINVPGYGQVTHFTRPDQDLLDSLRTIAIKLPKYAVENTPQKINWGKEKAPLIWLYEKIYFEGGIKQTVARSLVNAIFSDLQVEIDNNNTDKRKR